MKTHWQFKSVHNSADHKWRIFGVIVLVYLFLGLLLAMPAEALRLKTNWAQRVDLSEKILRGEVVEVMSYWNTEKTLIYTDVTVLIDEYLKGDGLREIIIKIPGGTVGDDTVWVSDTPQFAEGDYGVILLESSGQVTGGPDGVYLFQKPMEGVDFLQSVPEDKFISWIRSYINGQTNVSFEDVSEETSGLPMEQGVSYATISGASPSTISAGTNSVLTVSGSGFGASRGSGTFPTIAFRYKYSNYMFSNSQFISWSDTQIQLFVLTGIVNNYFHSPGSWSDTAAFVNSSGNKESTYALTVPFGYGAAKWATSPVPYEVNETGGPTGSAAAIQAAANTWSGAGTDFSFSYAGSTGSGYGHDGLNVISFANLGSSTIIGKATTYTSGSTITEADIQFNSNFAWSTDTATPGDKMDLQTITLHELGHWLRLLDLYGANDTGKVMYGFGSEGEMKRTLTSDDQQGIQWIYPSLQCTLTVNINPPAGGSVTKNPDKATYVYGDHVQLTASANPGYTFNNWTGDATGSTNPVTVTIDGNKTVTANFTQNQYALTVNLNPTAGGSVAKNPDKATYVYGDTVQLTATAGSGYTFSNWSGDASGSANPINLTMDANKVVTANFCPIPGTPLIPSPSNGAVGVATSPTLSWAATSNTDSYDVYFGTTNPPTTNVATTSTTNCSPSSALSFATTYYWQIVAKNNCGNSATGPVWSFATRLLGITPNEGTIGTIVTIKGNNFGASKNKVLIGNVALSVLSWGSSEILASLNKTPPSGTYSVTVQPKTKGAQPITEANLFTVRTPEIDSVSPNSGAPGQTITISGKFFGTKKGKVTIGGKACKVTSWKMDTTTGASTIEGVVPKGLKEGTYDLKVINTIGEDKQGFTIGQPQQYTLTVTKAGTGSGTVTSNPAGINCGADCSEAYNQGTSVTLTATPDSGSTFTGWSGACSGTGACIVNMTSDKAVTAAFAVSYDGTWNGTTSQGKEFSLTVSNNGIASFRWGISCAFVDMSSTTQFSSPIQITGNTFSLGGIMVPIWNGITNLMHTVTINGTFGSPSSASGTIGISGSLCNASATWSATK